MKPGGAMRVMLQGTTPWRIRRRLSVRWRQMYVSTWKFYNRQPGHSIRSAWRRQRGRSSPLLSSPILKEILRIANVPQFALLVKRFRVVSGSRFRVACVHTRGKTPHAAAH